MAHTSFFAAMDQDGDGNISAEEYEQMKKAMGSQFSKMRHVPDKAVQHALFVSEADEPRVTLKPGQHTLRRESFYAAEAKPNKEPYICQEKVFSSEYDTSTCKLTLPEDYKYRQKQFRPKESEGGGGGTAHWGTEYQKNYQVRWDAAEFRCSKHAPYSPRGAPPKSWSTDVSTHQEAYGRYGSNPRNLIKPGDPRLPFNKSSLHHGTSKGSSHLPGYQGFLPQCPPSTVRDALRPLALTKSGGADGPVFTPRSIDKSNIQETYHTNVVGYAGHIPQSARNDLGGRKPTDRTWHGREFVDPSRAAWRKPVDEC